MTIYLLCDDVSAQIKYYVTTLKEVKDWIKQDETNHWYFIVSRRN